MKLVKNHYYTAKGEKKICSYFISISKKMIEKSKFDPEKECVLEVKNDKIIITQK